MSTTNMNELLDGFIPLKNASHADVSCYSVEIPMRYCECVALLSDGSKTALEDPRAFVGWSCNDEERCYLFQSGDLLIEIRTHSENSEDRKLPMDCRNIVLQLIAMDQARVVPTTRGTAPCRKYTGIDGGLFVLN